MGTPKEEAKRLIEQMPDDATWHDIMYLFYVAKKIEAGIAADDAGDVVPHEVVEGMFCAD
jgi:hypothetical protein